MDLLLHLPGIMPVIKGVHAMTSTRGESVATDWGGVNTSKNRAPHLNLWNRSGANSARSYMLRPHRQVQVSKVPLPHVETLRKWFSPGSSA